MEFGQDSEAEFWPTYDLTWKITYFESGESGKSGELGESGWSVESDESSESSESA